jgi:hypothetical protein
MTYLVNRVGMLSTTHGRNVIPDVLLTLLDGLLICFLEKTVAQLDIADELVTSTLCEVLSDNNTQHLDTRVGSHGVSGDDPTSRTEVVSESKLIVVAIRITALFNSFEAEGNEGETSSRSF